MLKPDERDVTKCWSCEAEIFKHSAPIDFMRKECSRCFMDKDGHNRNDRLEAL